MSSMVTGYERRETMDGCVLYLSLMSLAAWRGEAERGKGKGEIRSKEKTELEPVTLSPITTKSLVVVLKSRDTRERTG